MRSSSAVMFVSDLGRSIDFYVELLRAEVTVRTSTAALLVDADDFQLYLRQVGPRAEHALGAIGIQYLVWSTDDPDEMERCEEVLLRVSPHVTIEVVEGIDVLEGRGPDGVPIMIVSPGPDHAPRASIMPRIYGW